jgi:two-component system, LytTR family, sensor kinase
MRRILLLWAISIASWSVYALFHASLLVGMGTPLDASLDGGEALRLSAIGALPWVPLSLGMYALVRRFPLDRKRPWRSLALVLVLTAVVIAVRAAYVGAINPYLPYWYPEAPPWTELLSSSLRNNLVITLMLVGALQAWVLAQRSDAQRLRIAELEAGLTRAHLDALGAQLNPHFLFNTLNSAAELVHHDPDTADRILVSLSALLRSSLSGSAAHEVPVDEEVALARDYLAIQQIRFGERLVVEYAIEEGCERALIPAMLLQPLIENAVVHGVARRRGPSLVRVEIGARAGCLRTLVRDSGAAQIATGGHRGSGVGLANTRARLRCLYGEQWNLSIEGDSIAGTEVRVELPLRRSPAASSPVLARDAEAIAG